MSTLCQIRRHIASRLAEAGNQESESIARLLLADTLNLSLTDIFVKSDLTLDKDTESHLETCLNRLLSGEPLQYVVGSTVFCGLTLAVGQGVLIPRPETEELVGWVVSDLNKKGQGRVVDLCTGSGCIALSIKHLLPQMSVCGVDVSSVALAYAQRNATTLSLDVSFTQANILDPNYSLPTNVSVVVSNPPYVRMSEAAEMSSVVLDNEPHEALFVPDTDPLIFYRLIGRLCVSAHADFYAEVNEAFATELVSLLTTMGFCSVEVRQDFTGRPRMIRCLIS